MGLNIYSTAMACAKQEKFFSFRKSMVLEALERGIKPTAMRLNMSKNTVRKWLRRFKNEGNKGLVDRRNGPNFIPHKTSKVEEEKIVKIRKRVPCYGARRLKYFFQLKASEGAIERIIRDYGLAKKRKKKYQKKNDLRAVKARYRAFEKVQMDVKYLTDLPAYWEDMKKLKLPRFQYTVRDVKSGMLFLGFADEISNLHAQEMAKHVLRKMVRGFPGKVTVQTDNGVEFSGTTRKFENNHFRKAVKELGAEHRYIPPGHCNANADVESIHATIEDEFYDITKFLSRKDFLKKAESYRVFYNLERPNFSKGRKTPWLIAQEDHPNKDLATSIQFTSVVDLDELIKAKLGGHEIPVFPEIALM